MTMRSYPMVIAANAQVEIDGRATFCKIVSNTGATGSLTMKAENASNQTVGADFLTVNVGDKPKFAQPCDKLTFYNTTGAPINVTAIIGIGDHEQYSLVGNVGLNNWSGQSLSSPADNAIAASASLDLAADATIRERVFQALTSNTGELCVRDQTGITSAGFRLIPAVRWYSVMARRSASGTILPQHKHFPS